jgi:hypothetical protein
MTLTFEELHLWNTEDQHSVKFKATSGRDKGFVLADFSGIGIINTEYDRPFTVDGFSRWLRDAITAAGLPLDCKPHGLRKVAGRRLDPSTV